MKKKAQVFNVAAKYRRVIILLADGARPDVLDDLISEGKLPAIKRHLLDHGSKLTAVTAFPSTTGPAYMPFLTGCLPATCNVPGIRWMDKVRFEMNSWHPHRIRSYVGLETYWIARDMRREIPTLFELLKNSYNIFNSVNKGVSFAGNRTRLSRIWYWYYAHLTDRWGFVDRSAIDKFSKLLSRPFDLIFMILPGVDEYSHIASYKHAETIEAYRRVDEAVHVAYSKLSERGMWDDTLFWLVSDHGLSVTHTHFCINKFLDRRGIRTLYYPKIFRKNCVAANMVSGNSMTHLYFSHDHGWQYPVYREDLERKYPGLLDSFLAEDAVDVIACRLDARTIEVATKRGRAKVRLEGDYLEYDVAGADPFGYEGMKSHFSSDESLALTYNSNYPDAVYQIAHLFTSPRTGDVVISAARGYDLREDHEVPEHKGSHGSLHREHMLVPVICNSNLSSACVRTVDIFPTTLSLLGHPVPGNIDGKIISPL